MRTMSAKDAKNHFGELLLEAQKAPVTIEKNGRPVATSTLPVPSRSISTEMLDSLVVRCARPIRAAPRSVSSSAMNDLLRRCQKRVVFRVEPNGHPQPSSHAYVADEHPPV